MKNNRPQGHDHRAAPLARPEDSPRIGGHVPPFMKALLTTAMLLAADRAFSFPLIIDTPGSNAINSTQNVDDFWIGENNSNVAATIDPSVTITVNSGKSCVLGVNASSTTNSLTVSSTAVLTGPSNLNVGYQGGSNTVTIASGGSVSAGNVWMGGLAGSTGNVMNVSGMLGASTGVIVGHGAGANALNVLAGGQVNNSGDATLGLVAGAPGNSATATGASALWKNLGHLYVGYASIQNSLTLSGEGKLTTETAVKDILIGAMPGADNNETTVTGQNSELSNTHGTLYVGRSGNNNLLKVLNQGKVSSKNVRIGGGSGASGSPTGNLATVDGNNSQWLISGTLRVGGGVAGTNSGLSITNGGAVAVSGNSFMGYDQTSDGNQVLIDGASSQLTVKNLVMGGINPAESSVDNVLTLKNGGKLTVNPILSDDIVRIREGNELAFGTGGGTIELNGSQIVSRGVLSAQAGVTGIINGDYVQEGPGIFRTGMADNTTYGRIEVDGAVDLPPRANMDVRVDDCDQITAPRVFPGVIASTGVIPFAGMRVTDNCPGLTFTARPDATGLAINLYVMRPGGPANQHCRFFASCP